MSIHRTFVLASVAVAAAAAIAHADPAPPVVATAELVHRVVLIDSTPDLAHAARTSLAPWMIDVTEATWPPDRPHDDAAAIELGRALSADRVAWLAGGELVVVDPTTGGSDRRPAPDGADDPVTAAAVALTLKTVLRLPPPGTVVQDDPDPRIDPPVVIEPPGAPIRIVPEVDGAWRIPLGGTLDPQPRVLVGLGIVHPRWPQWRPSLVAGFGPSVDAGKSGFKGQFADVELGLQLAVDLAVSRSWVIVPRARVAAHRIHVSGRMPPQEDFDAHDVGFAAGADVALWWRAGGLRAGAGVGAAALLGLSDYDRGNVMVFAAPRGTFQAFVAVLLEI